jgi:hypothetical protein
MKNQGSATFMVIAVAELHMLVMRLDQQNTLTEETTVGTVLQVASGVAAIIVAAGFGLLFHWKINAYDIKNPWQYESRHAPTTVQPVPLTYIPEGILIQHRELWRARIEGTAEYLRVPISMLEECYQKRLVERLSNWNWVNVPSSEWPTVWTN